MFKSPHSDQTDRAILVCRMALSVDFSYISARPPGAGGESAHSSRLPVFPNRPELPPTAGGPSQQTEVSLSLCVSWRFTGTTPMIFASKPAPEGLPRRTGMYPKAFLNTADRASICVLFVKERFFQGKGPPECPAVHETSGRPLQSISDCDRIAGKVALISLFDVLGHRNGARRIAAANSGSAMRVIFLPSGVLSHIRGQSTRTSSLRAAQNSRRVFCANRTRQSG